MQSPLAPLPPPPPPAPPAASAEAASRLIADRFIDRTVIVHIPDGRAFRGTLLCIDSGVNIILANTDELRFAASHAEGSRASTAQASSNGSSSTFQGFTERNIGMIMVPGKFVTRFEVEQDHPSGANDFHNSANRHRPTTGPHVEPGRALAGWPEDPDMYA